MRSLLVFVVSLCLAGAATAQTRSDADCLDLGALAGQPLGVLWANSFSNFLADHEGDLSKDQANLLRLATDFGLSPTFKLDDPVAVSAMKGMIADARTRLNTGQFSEILARMGPDAQFALDAVGVISPGDIACSCTTGAGTGCPAGFPCTVGCVTWGTGAWNGICKREATVN